MIKMIKIVKTSEKMKLLIRNWQRDSETGRVITLDACIDKDAGQVQSFGSKS